MTTTANDPLLQSLLDIAAAASALVLRYYVQGFEVAYKGPGDPVTSADRAANELIASELAQRFPGVPVVAEESEPSRYAGFVDAERAFFVDPIDGTREFVAKTGEFVVMIGLAERGRATAGVVFSPVKNCAWFGRVGEGAQRVDDAGTRSVRPSGTTELGLAVLLAAHGADTDEEALARAIGVGKVQSVGSAGLKGALIAEGSADLYLSPERAGQRWDACAIDALLAAAGGTLTDTHGHRLDYQRPNLHNDAGLLATNGLLLPYVLERLRRERADGNEIR